MFYLLFLFQVVLIRTETKHARDQLDPLMERCFNLNGLNTVERNPCRFVCENLVYRKKPIFVKRLPEAVCDDLP